MRKHLRSFGHDKRWVQASWPGQGVELCVLSTTTTVRPDSTCSDAFSSSSGCEAPVARLQGQQGEIEDVQILLRKGRDADDRVGGVSDVSVNVDLDDSDVADATIFRVGYVWADHSPRQPGSGGGWRPDPLLPVPKDKTFAVPPDVAQPLWISFRLSRDAKPGVHNGTIVVAGSYNSGSESNFSITIPIQITVFDLQLPLLNDSHLGSAWSGRWTADAFTPYYGKSFDWNSSRFDWYDLMIDQRMPPDAIYLTSLRDFDEYDYMASKGVKWFALLDVSSLPLDPPHPSSSSSSSISTPFSPSNAHGGKLGGSCANYTDEYVTRLVATLRPAVEYLRSRGLIERAYVYGFDENPPSCEPQVRKLFGATKQAFPDLKTAAVLNWSPMPVDLPVDIWILQYEEYDASDAASWIAAGKEQWQYHCIEPHDLASLNAFTERPIYQPRFLFWLAALTRLQSGAPTGWLYYAVNLWNPCDNPLCTKNYTSKEPIVQNLSSPFVDFPIGNYIWQPTYNDIFANGDGQYIYPCEDGKPCGSIRLSAIRDGLEDWDGLFWNVEKSVGEGLLQTVVRGPRDWEFRGHEALESVRLQAARSQIAPRFVG